MEVWCSLNTLQFICRKTARSCVQSGWLQCCWSCMGRCDAWIFHRHLPNVDLWLSTYRNCFPPWDRWIKCQNGECADTLFFSAVMNALGKEAAGSDSCAETRHLVNPFAISISNIQFKLAITITSLRFAYCMPTSVCIARTVHLCCRHNCICIRIPVSPLWAF